MKKTGADIIVEALIAAGIKRLYNFPGGTIAPILDVAAANNLEIVTARHEQGAGYAALAEARLSGNPQVVAVTSGPGVTNIVTPVADAWYDSTPLLVLTGQVGTGDMKRDLPVRQRGFQEVETVRIFESITKARFLVEHSEDLPQVMREAMRISLDSRPGPVLVDLPMNIQRDAVKRVPEFSFDFDLSGEAPEPGELDLIMQSLRSSARPLAIVGHGVILSQAYSNLRAFLERTKMPVSHSLLGLGAVDSGWPLNLGFHGHTGSQAAGKAIQEADLLLVLGSRLDLRQTGTQVNEFALNAKIVRVEIDQAEIDHPRVASDLVIQSGVRTVLQELLKLLPDASMPDWSAWHARIKELKQQFSFSFNENGALKPQQVINKVDALTRDRNVICVTGVGSHQQWVARHFSFNYPDRILLTSGGHGAMGYDLPTAVGAQISHPDKLVLCIVGDGSFQLNIQELATIVDLILPVKIIVLDNCRLGIVSQFQKFNWETDTACGNKSNPEFSAIAHAYGLHAVRIDSKENMQQSLVEIISHDGPALAHCVVDPDEDLRPMLLAGQTLDGMWTGF